MRRHRVSHMGLLLLASQVFQVGMDNIPPVTLATLGLNVYLFLFPVTPLLQACVSLQQAYWLGDWRRLVLSPLHHVDDFHLYFNMASFLWKGSQLERSLGGAWFAYLLAVFSLLTGLVYLLLEAGLAQLTGDSAYSMQCAVGFSGVLFGLKVVNNQYHPGGVTHVMGGLPIANRYACWVELVLIHIMNPGTSFVGHLAGILVGLLYTAGPLKAAMATCAGFLGSNRYRARRHAYYNSSGYSGYEENQPYRRYQPYPPNAPRSGYDPYPSSATPRSEYDPYPSSAPPQHPYTGGLTEEQQYTTAIRASLSQRGHSAQDPPPPGFTAPPALTADEVRQRRLERFAR